MRIRVLALAASLLLISNTSVSGLQTPTATSAAPQRDPQAVVLLQNSVSAMGSLPSDSSASGNITIVAGSLTEQGTIHILTRGTSQTSVTVQAGVVNWSVIFSGGQSNRIEEGTTKALPLELSASSQSLHFPLPFVYNLLSNPDFSVQFVAQESLGTSTVNHIHVQNTFASQPLSQFLSEFTSADVWLDASTGLPAKISLARRLGGGSAPRIPISISYANYQSVSGVQYPFTIQEFITETLWGTTHIQSVSFNSGLTDTNFPILAGTN
jgi:hypothetical protein